MQLLCARLSRTGVAWEQSLRLSADLHAQTAGALGRLSPPISCCSRRVTAIIRASCTAPGGAAGSAAAGHISAPTNSSKPSRTHRHSSQKSQVNSARHASLQAQAVPLVWLELAL